MAKAAAKAPPEPLVAEQVDTDSLLDNPRNSQKHPPEQIDRLMASLRARGQYKPVLARRANHMLIAGHGVRTAVARLGWPTIRVVFWDVDQATADSAMLGDNRLGAISTSDDERVAELLRDIPERDWLSVGFSDDEAGDLLKELGDSEIEVHEIDVSLVHDTFWVSVRGPLAEQAEVLQKLKQLMSEHRAVTVQLATTAED